MTALVNGWQYHADEKGTISAVDPSGHQHTFPNWKAFWRASGGAGNGLLTGYTHKESQASLVFMVLFWVHQVLLGFPSVFIGIQLLSEGKATGIINSIGLLLAWIGGTLVWGLAALMYRKPAFDAPPIFTTIADNVSRLDDWKPTTLHSTQ